MNRILSFLFLLCCGCQLSLTHVALKYPPARKYDLDFLDNIRTTGPCGMPQGEDRTTIVAGSTFNVTWHLAYPHRGGYRLQLLTDEGRPWMNLTPANGPKGFLNDDPTAQRHQIQIPRNISCKGCSIRLEREATEWLNDYLFWSCADVNIVHEDEYKEDCFGNGVVRNGECICKKLYSGPRCQYKDECWEDADCGQNGKCINIKATTFPEKQCFCQMGWFGEQCNKALPIEIPDIDLSKHKSLELSNDFKLYWKVLPSLGEIEIVAKVKTTTYVGIGWRPKDLTSACKAFPKIEDHVVFHSAIEGVGVAEPEPLPEPETQPPPLQSTSKPVSESVYQEDRSRTIIETSPNETFIAHKGNATEVDLSADDAAVLEEASAEPKPEHYTRNDTTSTEGRGLGTVQEPAAEPAAKPTAEPAAKPTAESAANERTPIREEITEATAESNRHPVTLEVMTQKVNVHAEESSTNNDHAYVDDTQHGEVNYGSEHQTNEGLVEYVHDPDTYQSTHRSSDNARRKREVSSNVTDVTNENSTIRDYASAEPEATSEPIVNQTGRRGKADFFDKFPYQEADSVAEPEPISSISKAEPFVAPTSKSAISLNNIESYTPKADFHAMDCTDVVVGMTYGNYSRVFDYYTRDRSTPRVDSYWGGSDSLTAATGFDKDGYTTIIFRRKLDAIEVTDHSFVKGPMHVIWAKGQEPGSYIHSPLSGLETGKPSKPDFYHRDELKYHGHGSQRGVATIDFLNNQQNNNAVDESKGEFKIPSSCTVDDCEYRATWEFIPSQDLILFSVATNNSDKWTGIGFSDDTKMPNTDAILGWVDDSGRTFVMDVWIDQYGPPILDKIQNLEIIKGSKTNGRVSLSFTRKRNTGDSQQDLAFTDSNCLYMMYPFDGGVFNAVSKKIRQHDSQPIVSRSKICIRGNGVADSGDDVNVVQSLADVVSPTVSRTSTVPPSPSTSPKPTSAYMVSIRLPNQTLDDAIERGIDFKMLIREGLNDYISDALQHIEGFKKAEVTALDSEKNEAHVVAKMLIYVESSLNSKEMSKNFIENTVNKLNKTLRATISKGKVGRLIVDPAYLVIDPPQISEPPVGDITYSTVASGEQDAHENTLLYVIIAAVAALGFLFLVQIICMLCRCHTARKTNLSKERLIVGSAGWKDYAAGASPGNGSTYDYEHNYNSHKEDTPKLNKYPLNSNNGTSRSGINSSNNGQSRSVMGSNGFGETRSLNRHPRGVLSMDPDRNHYSRRSESLPRPHVTSDNHTYDARDRVARPSSAASMYPQGGLQPDFYFMPSQRRYSGEVVRVYVDYNNPNYTGK